MFIRICFNTRWQHGYIHVEGLTLLLDYQQMGTAEIREYICPEKGCSSKFKTLSHMNTHLLVHSDERPFVCPEEDCSLAFKRADHLRRHQQQCHEQGGSFSCTYSGCLKTFCSVTSLKRHEKRRHSCPKYKCSNCGAVLFKKKQLMIHEAQHKDEKPFRCDVEGCGKAFATPNRLTVHNKQHKGYECSVASCKAVFYKWSLLLQHKKTEHPKEFPCDKCDKKFLTNFNLKKHKLVHSEMRVAYHCPHEGCTRQYFEVKNLNIHLKRYHQELCFICPREDCQRKFAHKKSLSSHLESHVSQKPRKPKVKVSKRYNFIKRRSAAAMISGHRAEKQEENRILEEDRELTLASVKEQLEKLTKSGHEQASLSVDTLTAPQRFVMQEA